jgi:uncharacterized protein (DUF427 family)
MGDTLLAESRAVVILYEPGYPPRYYFPRLNVKMTLLEETEKVTSCPHKGRAEYYRLKSTDGVQKEIAWSYRAANLNVAEISGYISFYDDGVVLTIG